MWVRILWDFSNSCECGWIHIDVRTWRTKIQLSSKDPLLNREYPAFLEEMTFSCFQTHISEYWVTNLTPVLGLNAIINGVYSKLAMPIASMRFGNPTDSTSIPPTSGPSQFNTISSFLLTVVNESKCLVPT